MRSLALLLALAAPAWTAGGQRSHSSAPAPVVVVAPALGQSALPSFNAIPSLPSISIPGVAQVSQVSQVSEAPLQPVASLAPAALAQEASSAAKIPQARALELKAALTSLVADPVALAALGPEQAAQVQAALRTITLKTAAARDERTNASMLEMVARLGPSRKNEDAPGALGGAQSGARRASMLGAVDGIRTGGADDGEPPAPRAPSSKPHPLAKAAFLASVFGVLLALPPAAGATIGKAATFALPVLPDATTLLAGAAVAAVLAALRIALAFVTVRFSPSDMNGKNPDLQSRSLLSLVPPLILAAVMEEFAFRAFMTPVATALLVAQGLGPALALAAATLLVSAIFAVVHGYGQFWSRVVGGSYYTAVYVLSGSLLFTAAVHFLFNLGTLALLRTALGKRIEAWSDRAPSA